ncbi:hypothetical protein [Corynebacterium variabile]|uniref:hypothetical protein n=1 Tax=Corynebacterium variabile TaxID=1727 RepID=UPI003FCFEC48
MHHNEQSPAPVAAGTRETSNYQAAHSSDYATPHHLTLHPTSGADWWSWCISINGRSAIRFRGIYDAALTLSYLLDDMENGVDITRREALWLAAAGAMKPGQKNAEEFQIVEGWS